MKRDELIAGLRRLRTRARQSAAAMRGGSWRPEPDGHWGSPPVSYVNEARVEERARARDRDAAVLDEAILILEREGGDGGD